MARGYLKKKEFVNELWSLYEKGYNDANVCRALNIAQSTLAAWNRKESFKRRKLLAKMSANGLVSNAVYKRATGMQVKEISETLDKYGKVHELVTVKELPPDMTAAKFWLTNQDKEHWKESEQVQLNQQLIGVSTSDLLLTLQSGVRNSLTGGEGMVSVSVDVAAAQLPSSPLLPTSDLNLQPTDLIEDDAESKYKDPITRDYNPSHANEVVRDILYAQEEEVGPEMSDEEYLRSLVNESSEEK